MLAGPGRLTVSRFSASRSETAIPAEHGCGAHGIFFRFVDRAAIETDPEKSRHETGTTPATLGMGIECRSIQAEEHRS